MAYDANGFTTFTLAGDAKAVYVADDGNDGNDGLTDSTPKLTIAAGYALLTSGKPDWLLLKRGSTFSTGFGQWKKVGRSASEPMRIAHYGSAVARPKCNTANLQGLYREGGGGSPASIDYLAVQGIEFTPDTYTGTGSPTGLSWLGPGGNLLIEDCVFDAYFNGVSVQGDENGRPANITIRRNIIRNSFGNSGHSQGIFASAVDGLTVEENVIDNCGVDGTEGPTIFKHDMYITSSCTGVSVNNNLLTRASSHGCQLRPGGSFIGNVIIQCPLGMFTATGEVRNNVILEGTDITGAILRGWGIEVVEGSDVLISDNVIANKTSTNNAGAVILSPNAASCSNVRVLRNRIYNWRGGIQLNSGTHSGHVFRDNDIQSDIPADTATLVTTASGTDPAGFAWSGNNYYRDAGGNEFSDEGVARAYAAWVTAAGEVSSSNTQTTFPDTAKTLQDYTGFIAGATHTFDDAIDLLQEQSSENWNESLRIQRIAAALRQGWIAATWLEEVCLAIWAESTRELLTGSPHASGDYLQNICNEGWNETIRQLTIPDPPTNIQVVTFTTTTAQITATESVTAGVTRYRVYRGTSSGNLTLVADTSTDPSILFIDSGDIVYEPTGLSPGTTYYVTLVAVEDGIESNPTSEVSFTTSSLPGTDTSPGLIRPILRPILNPIIRPIRGKK